MHADRTENFCQQVGCAVQDFGVFLKLRGRVDGAVKRYHLCNLIERTKFVLHDADKLHARGTRKGITFFGRILSSELSLGRSAGGKRRRLAGDVQKVPGPHGRCVVACWRAGRGKHQAKFLEPLLWGHVLPVMFERLGDTLMIAFIAAPGAPCRIGTPEEVATVGEFKQFRCGAQFGAWIGLTPRQHSSGGKNS